MGSGSRRYSLLRYSPSPPFGCRKPVHVIPYRLCKIFPHIPTAGTMELPTGDTCMCCHQPELLHQCSSGGKCSCCRKCQVRHHFGRSSGTFGASCPTLTFVVWTFQRTVSVKNCRTREANLISYSQTFLRSIVAVRSCWALCECHWNSGQKHARARTKKSEPTRSEPTIIFSESEEDNIVLKKRRFQNLLKNLWKNLHLLQLN